MINERDDFLEEFDENEEQLGPQDVARFLRDFRSNVAHDILEEDKALIGAVLHILEMATARDLVYAEAQSAKRPLLATLHPPRRGTVFVTGRENWVQQFDAPIFVGEEMDGKSLVRVRQNSDGGSRFNFELLEETGLESVSILENGEIIAFRRSGSKELIRTEKLELADYISMASRRVAQFIDLEARLT